MCHGSLDLLLHFIWIFIIELLAGWLAASVVSGSLEFPSSAAHWTRTQTEEGQRGSGNSCLSDFIGLLHNDSMGLWLGTRTAQFSHKDIQIFGRLPIDPRPPTSPPPPPSNKTRRMVNHSTVYPQLLPRKGIKLGRVSLLQEWLYLNMIRRATTIRVNGNGESRTRRGSGR